MGCWQEIHRINTNFGDRVIYSHGRFILRAIPSQLGVQGVDEPVALGQYAKKRRLLRQSHRLPWVFVLTALLAGCSVSGSAVTVLCLLRHASAVVTVRTLSCHDAELPWAVSSPLAWGQHIDERNEPTA